MANLLTVQDPDEGASEEATQTRALLQAWADKHLPADDEAGIKALDDGEIKSLREQGVHAFEGAARRLEALNVEAPTLFGKLLGTFSYATRRAADCMDMQSQPREFSHVMEGMVREFSKQFFQAGMKWNLHAEYLALCSLHAPHRTSGQQDTVFNRHCKTLNTGGLAASQMLGLRNASEWDSLVNTSTARFAGILDWLITQAGPIEIGSEGKEYWARKLTRFSLAGFQLHYIDADGPWVAGFLNLDDACKMRFRRIRLGAYLKEQGMQDTGIRDRVEKAKQEVAGANFTAYPNDTRWEDVYTDGPGSCMASPAHEYECWDDLHPVDAYSAAYHGCGDNSLCLLVSKDSEGNNTGRGILNLQRGTIIRWYGDAVAERVLLRQGVKVSDRWCMQGSWLALLQKGARFIHPYVDGDLSYGKIDGNRVYIVDDSDESCIQDTNGSTYMDSTWYCIDTDEREPEDQCTHQEISGTYVSDNLSDDWRCPVIGEWDREHNRVSMKLHGVEVEVCEHTYYNRTQYLTPIGSYISRSSHSGPWHIDDDEMRAAFFKEHGLDEDESDDEDEEAA